MRVIIVMVHSFDMRVVVPTDLWVPIIFSAHTHAHWHMSVQEQAGTGACWCQDLIITMVPDPGGID